MNQKILAICGGEVFTPWKHFSPGLVIIGEGKISYIGAMEQGRIPANAQQLDASDKLVAPGFTDIHIHGSAGADFVRDGIEGLRKMAGFLASHGVTTFLPTTPSAPLDQLLERIEVARQAMQINLGGAQVLGIHLEGPYLSLQQRGAHKLEYLRNPTIKEIDALAEAGQGAVKMITLAPELPDALEAIRRLNTQGIVVSLGHSAATYDQTQAAIAEGATHGCHLFNCMPDLNKREPGMAGALLANKQIFIELIADAVHIHPLMLQLAIKMKGERLSVLISDAMEAAGMPEGEYRLGELQVSVRQGQARLEDGTLAGSTLSLDKAVKNAVEALCIPLREALAMATQSPSDSLNLPHKGRLEVGADGDVVVLDQNLSPSATIVNGTVVWQAD